MLSGQRGQRQTQVKPVRFSTFSGTTTHGRMARRSGAGFAMARNVRYLPLIEHKLRLRAVVPQGGERLLYCDHLEQDGEGLFQLACEHDLEGIVAKRKSDPYLPEHAPWLKIRNQSYSQWA